jgi:hypothetical protein
MLRGWKEGTLVKNVDFRAISPVESIARLYYLL